MTLVRAEAVRNISTVAADNKILDIILIGCEKNVRIR